MKPSQRILEICDGFLRNGNAGWEICMINAIMKYLDEESNKIIIKEKVE